MNLLIPTHTEEPSPYEMKRSRQLGIDLTPQDDNWMPQPEQDQSLWDRALEARERVIQNHRMFWRNAVRA